MSKLKAFLLEQLDLSAPTIKAHIDSGLADLLDKAVTALEAAKREDKIYNVVYGDIKDTIRRAYERSFKKVYDAQSRDDWKLFYEKSDLNTFGDMAAIKKNIRVLTDALKPGSGLPAGAATETMKKIAEEALKFKTILDELKSKVLKGRVPKPVDPNAFHNKLGSKEAQKLVSDSLKEGIKQPLDDVREAVKKYCENQLETVAKLDKFTKNYYRHGRDRPFEESNVMNLGKYFTFNVKKLDAFYNGAEEWTDFKLNAVGKAWPAREADDYRAVLEHKFLAKNVQKLSNIVDLKGNLTKIEELPYKKPAVNGNTVEAGFKFLFDDGSEFKVINKIVSKYRSYNTDSFFSSHGGTQYSQFPTTFHDVKLPDGSKMSVPSEEKMVKVFATAKLTESAERRDEDFVNFDGVNEGEVIHAAEKFKKLAGSTFASKLPALAEPDGTPRQSELEKAVDQAIELARKGLALELKPFSLEVAGLLKNYRLGKAWMLDIIYWEFMNDSEPVNQALATSFVMHHKHKVLELMTRYSETLAAIEEEFAKAKWPVKDWKRYTKLVTRQEEAKVNLERLQKRVRKLEAA